MNFTFTKEQAKFRSLHNEAVTSCYDDFIYLQLKTFLGKNPVSRVVLYRRFSTLFTSLKALLLPLYFVVAQSQQLATLNVFHII